MSSVVRPFITLPKLYEKLYLNENWTRKSSSEAVREVLAASPLELAADHDVGGRVVQQVAEA